jgi:hypothetical protein
MTGTFDLTPEQNDTIECACDACFHALVEDVGGSIEEAEVLFGEMVFIAFAQHLDARHSAAPMAAIRVNALLEQLGSKYRLTEITP